MFVNSECLALTLKLLNNSFFFLVLRPEMQVMEQQGWRMFLAGLLHRLISVNKYRGDCYGFYSQMTRSFLWWSDFMSLWGQYILLCLSPRWQHFCRENEQRETTTCFRLYFLVSKCKFLSERKKKWRHLMSRIWATHLFTCHIPLLRSRVVPFILCPSSSSACCIEIGRAWCLSSLAKHVYANQYKHREF